MPPVRRHPAERPEVRLGRQRAWAAGIFVLGLLLFVWPFVRTPRLSIGLSYAHLLGAWAVVVIGLFAMARGLGGDARRGGDDG